MGTARKAGAKKKTKVVKKVGKKKRRTSKQNKPKVAKTTKKAVKETPKKELPRHSTAEDMARGQREISVAEFFMKNRHLLGFDNPRKALLSTAR
ncbi:MAG: hypothetical protein ACETWQ_22000 [Phycisphaerae bacterium]